MAPHARRLDVQRLLKLREPPRRTGQALIETLIDQLHGSTTITAGTGHRAPTRRTYCAPRPVTGPAPLLAAAVFAAAKTSRH
jgi:hypothetical protein